MKNPFSRDLPVFQTIDAYPFLKPLQENWREILAEFQQYRYLAKTFERTDLHNNLWEIYFLVHQNKLQPAWELCPVTRSLVKDIPGLYLVGFSIQKPGARIYPHRGYTTDVWRSHLGLICPNGAWLEVARERYEWKAGEMIVFDDMRKHHSANESLEERVILMVDFKK